ncbi:hypothetical protein HK103_000299 [Boothiomyces macroporosus]|uniref:Uncharacterized protein n=1 Tax=Boothiomyces macroporosus TaxID=261099 RepID=A0AAD5UKM4_9FUNG|nr:hypothetical protein HK103_000277 [Boothiomyces macroporosus]KAJ3260689.1 hypothetical protein HK103_000299 [Boothiomyces macroporosus]
MGGINVVVDSNIPLLELAMVDKEASLASDVEVGISALPVLVVVWEDKVDSTILIVEKDVVFNRVVSIDGAPVNETKDREE